MKIMKVKYSKITKVFMPIKLTIDVKHVTKYVKLAKAQVITNVYLAIHMKDFSLP